MADTTSPTGLTIEEVDQLTVSQMLNMWRNAPVGTFAYGDPVTERFMERMNESREVNPGAWVAASKSFDW